MGIIYVIYEILKPNGNLKKFRITLSTRNLFLLKETNRILGCGIEQKCVTIY